MARTIPALYIQDITLPTLRGIPDRARVLAMALDRTGVDAVEMGLDDIATLAPLLTCARASVLLHPGMDTVDDLRRAYGLGVRSVRVAVSCLDAGPAAPLLSQAHELGLDTACLLLSSHLASPTDLARQAKAMEAAGAACIYVVDSDGALDMDGVAARLRAFDRVLLPATQRGIQAHHGLSLAVANSLVAVQNGALRVDAALCSPGPAPLDLFIAAATRKGWAHGCDAGALAEAVAALGQGRAA